MWAQIINIIIGIWLMASPEVLMYSGAAADNDHIIGPVITSFAIIALSGCTRFVARYNTPLGIWLLLAPWILGYTETVTIYNDIVSGILVTALSFFMRKTSNQYGGGWTAIWKSDTPHARAAKGEASSF